MNLTKTTSLQTPEFSVPFQVDFAIRCTRLIDLRIWLNTLLKSQVMAIHIASDSNAIASSPPGTDDCQKFPAYLAIHLRNYKTTHSAYRAFLTI